MNVRSRSSKPYPVFMALLLAAAWSWPAAAEVSLIAAFEPPDPTDNELVRLILSGTWRDSCKPYLRSVTVNADTVRIDAETPSGVGCLAAVDIFAFTAAVGPLRAGSYVFEIYLTDFALDPDAEPVLWASSNPPLEVTDAPDEVAVRDGRFLVRVSWQDFASRTGPGRVLPTPSEDTAFFWFFGPENVELMVKVLDGCRINGHFWVFGAAATDIEYSITIIDTETGSAWSYDNPLGRASPAITDTGAFATCP